MGSSDWLKYPHVLSETKFHCGHDIFESVGTDVFAISDGVVEHNGTDLVPMHKNIWFKFYHEDGSVFYAVYGHVNSTLEKGTKVKAGQVVGTIASFEPDRYSPHLHLGINIRKDITFPIDFPWGTARTPNGWSLADDPDKIGLADKAASEGWVQPRAYLYPYLTKK